MSTDPLTTCPEAADQYRQGLERLLDGDADAAARAFGVAVDHDPGFALGHAARASTVSDESESRAAIARARQATRRTSRRERQQVSIIDLVVTGRVSRASALAREHLAEFPDDTLILHVVTRHTHDLDDLKL